MKKETIFRAILVVLLLLCLYNWSYGYYQLVRYITMTLFTYFTYIELQKKQTNSNIILLYIFIIILFQPLFKISLGRTLWNIVDVILAVFLIYEINQKKK